MMKREVDMQDPGAVKSGHAVEIIKVEEDHSFTLDEPALERILLDSRVKHRKVIVLSIAGAFRTGKSFLLNFFLRYLKAQGSQNWMGDPDAPLEGFLWKGGADRVTSGILMWSEPLELVLASGESTFVLLMDTQGSFGNQSTDDYATVFALSTMLSSIQIYNISTGIKVDDLQRLQLLTEYGRLVWKSTHSKPFQNLYFLVRDWSCTPEYEHGWKGGEKLLEKRLKHKDLPKLGRRLHKYFAKSSCFLMPRPGLKVTMNPQFNGRLSDIEKGVKFHTEMFVSSVLSSKNLMVKKTSRMEITGKELLAYFKVYIKIFQGSRLPDPESMFEATAEAYNLAAVERAKDVYTDGMEEVCGRDRPFISNETINKEHQHFQEKAIKCFKSIGIMGGKELSQIYLKNLNFALTRIFDGYSEKNMSKKENTSYGLQAAEVVGKVAVQRPRGYGVRHAGNAFVAAGMMAVDLFRNFFGNLGQ